MLDGYLARHNWWWLLRAFSGKKGHGTQRGLESIVGSVNLRRDAHGPCSRLPEVPSASTWKRAAAELRCDAMAKTFPRCDVKLSLARALTTANRDADVLRKWPSDVSALKIQEAGEPAVPTQEHHALLRGSEFHTEKGQWEGRFLASVRIPRHPQQYFGPSLAAQLRIVPSFFFWRQCTATSSPSSRCARIGHSTPGLGHDGGFELCAFGHVFFLRAHCFVQGLRLAVTYRPARVWPKIFGRRNSYMPWQLAK